MENITGTTVTELFGPLDVSSKESIVYRVFLVSLISLMCVFGVIGNCLVAFAIARYPNLRTVTNYLIVSLAVADATVCAWVMPIAAYQDLNGGMWRLGDILCDLWVGSDVLMSTASIWNLCAVSVDRYLAISRPIWYATKRKLTFALILISVAWSFSFMTSIMSLFIVGGFQGNEDAAFCAVNTQPSFGIAASLLAFYMPACAILVLYALILRSAMRLKSSVRPLHMDPDQPSHSVEFSTRYPFHSKSQPSKETVATLNSPNNERNGPAFLTTGDRKKAQGPEKTVSFEGQAQTIKCDERSAHAALDQGPSQSSRTMGPTGGTSEERGNNDKKRRVKISISRERRAALVIGVVVIAFIACWLPFFSIFFVISACTTCSVSLGVFQFVTWLGWCNSALNPVIYTIFNREFRQAFRKIFSRKNS